MILEWHNAILSLISCLAWWHVCFHPAFALIIGIPAMVIFYRQRLPQQLQRQVSNGNILMSERMQEMNQWMHNYLVAYDWVRQCRAFRDPVVMFLLWFVWCMFVYCLPMRWMMAILGTSIMMLQCPWQAELLAGLRERRRQLLSFHAALILRPQPSSSWPYFLVENQQWDDVLHRWHANGWFAAQAIADGKWNLLSAEDQNSILSAIPDSSRWRPRPSQHHETDHHGWFYYQRASHVNGAVHLMRYRIWEQFE